MSKFLERQHSSLPLSKMLLNKIEIKNIFCSVRKYSRFDGKGELERLIIDGSTLKLIYQRIEARKQ